MSCSQNCSALSLSLTSGRPTVVQQDVFHRDGVGKSFSGVTERDDKTD